MVNCSAKIAIILNRYGIPFEEEEVFKDHYGYFMFKINNKYVMITWWHSPVTKGRYHYLGGDDERYVCTHLGEIEWFVRKEVKGS